MRTATALMATTAVVSAVALYTIGFETRRLESEVHARERELDRLKAEVSVLTGERAYLARPERIEPLARLQGLAPLKPDQIEHRAPPEAAADVTPRPVPPERRP